MAVDAIAVGRLVNQIHSVVFWTDTFVAWRLIQYLSRDRTARSGMSARDRTRWWARLIKRVYEADPLVSPGCSGPLKMISLIGAGPVIYTILRHLKPRDRPERPPLPLPVSPSCGPSPPHFSRFSHETRDVSRSLYFWRHA